MSALLFRVAAWLLVALIPLSLLGWCQLQSRSIRFDSVVWRDASVGAETLGDRRYRMRDDLLTTRPLMGRSRIQVVNLLGPPTRFDQDTGSSIYYYLGTGDQFMPIDPYLLQIRFDDHGVVSSVEVIIG